MRNWLVIAVGIVVVALAGVLVVVAQGENTDGPPDSVDIPFPDVFSNLFPRSPWSMFESSDGTFLYNQESGLVFRYEQTRPFPHFRAVSVELPPPGGH